MTTRAFIVHRLRCGHCGADLPAAGRSVTFRCPACRRLWAADGDRLVPVAIERAELPDGLPPGRERDDILYLPFWSVQIDLPRLGESAAAIMQSLRGAQAAAACGAAMALPPAPELDHFLRTISERGVFRVFVPAFDAPGEQVRLSVGRLMTRCRPELRTVPSDGSGRAGIPVILPREALVLSRYVFVSILPESIVSCAGFMDRIEIAHAAAPLLVEFPFAPRGGEIESLLGGFHVPARLVGIGGGDAVPL